MPLVGGSGGSGGDFSGPGSSTDDNIVVFNGTGGKTGKDGGTTIAALTASILATVRDGVSGSFDTLAELATGLATKVTSGGALGTPSSGTLTSCTGLPIAAGVSGLGTGVATLLATPSSDNLRAALTDETGTGAAVFATSPALTTPNIGTPSAGVLTSCTGLPIATGVTGLGANVGTFLATPSVANLAAAVTGGVLKLAGKETIWVPASAMTAKATNGAAAGTYDSGSNDISIPTFDFDTTTKEYVHFNVAFPKSYNNGPVTFQAYWTNTAGLTTETMAFSLAGVAISDDDSLNATFGTAVTQSDTWIAQNDLHISAESSAVTIGGTPASADLVMFEVARETGTDNMTGDGRLIGIKLFYTSNAATDA